MPSADSIFRAGRGAGAIKRLVVLAAAALSLSACASLQPQRCPAGQSWLRTAQLFFGRDLSGKGQVSEADFRTFVNTELTPRFPDGLTILDGGGQWRGDENKLIRESAKVVLIVLPPGPEAERRIEAVRAAYKARFQQESVLLVTQPACVSF